MTVYKRNKVSKIHGFLFLIPIYACRYIFVQLSAAIKATHEFPVGHLLVKFHLLDSGSVHVVIKDFFALKMT